MAFIDCNEQISASKSAWPERPHCEHGEWTSNGTTTWKSHKAMKKYDARRRKRARARAVEYLGGVCANCGTPGNDAMGPLEFDHIDPDTKTFVIASRLSSGLPKLLTELDKCQLLHRECHKVKTAQEAAQRATAKQDQLDALINTYQGSEAA